MERPFSAKKQGISRDFGVQNKRQVEKEPENI